MQRIALLGVGTMGAGMAPNWLKKGFPLTIWNRTPRQDGAFCGARRDGRRDPARGGGGRGYDCGDGRR